MALGDYVGAIRRRWWLVLGAVVLSTAIALGLSAAQTPLYEAEARMLVETRSTDTIFGTGIDLRGIDATRAIETEIKVLEGERVRSRLVDILDLASDPPEVEASILDATDVVAVRVRSADPREAQRLANSYVQAYIEERRSQSVDNLLAASAQVQDKLAELTDDIEGLDEDDPQRSVLLAQQAGFREILDQLQVDAALKTGGASVVESAELPSDPVVPTTMRNVALAVCVGLLVGLGIALLREHLDDSLRTEDDFARVVPLPVLAAVPEDAPHDGRPVALSSPSDYFVEVFRGLRTNLQFLGLDQPVKLIQVTSSLPGEGKTTTVTNLAVVLAQAGRKVAIVDGDLRRPRVHQVFSVPQAPGLIDLLVGEPLEFVAQRLEFSDGSGITVVASGAVPANPGEVLSSNRAREALAELGAHYDYVLIDSAPVLPVADSVALAGAVDAVLFVAQARHTSRRDVAEAIGRLTRVGAPVVGMVLNQVKSAGPAVYAYGYRHGPAATSASAAEESPPPTRSQAGDPSTLQPPTHEVVEAPRT